MKYLPNCITTTRILILIPYAYFLYIGRYRLAFMLFMLAGFSDFIDGILARYFRWTSKLGSILDPLADKLLMLCSFFILYLIGQLPLYVLVILTFRDFYIMYGVIYIHINNPASLKFEPLMTSKVNTSLQLLLIFCLILNLSYVQIPILLINLVLVSVVMTSVISLIQYIKVGRNFLGR